ncbi:hypothetical protein MKW92_034549, partial [Papaver armeniacum]
ENLPVVLVGTKCDVPKALKTNINFTKARKMTYFRVSSKDEINILEPIMHFGSGV